MVLSSQLAASAAAQPADSASSAPSSEPDRAPDQFPILALDILGVTKLSVAEIERATYAFTGPARSGADVEAARKAVQDAYAAKGYEAVVVEIPAQPTELFAAGIVQIKVSEAPVGRVNVVDSKHHSPRVVRAQVPSLVEGEPLNLRALQTDIANANRFPDRQVSPSFKPGTEPGTLDVDLRVDDELPLHANVEINNDNSPSTSRLRLAGGVRYTDLWKAGHSLSASFLVSPENRSDTEVFSGSYSAPLIGTPWSLLLYGYASNSNIAALGGTNVLGDGFQIGARGIYRLPSDGNYQSVSFGVDYKDFAQDISVDGVPIGSAPIKYLPLTVEYNYARSGERSSLDFLLGVTAGLRVIKRSTCVDVGTGPCVPVDQFRNREFDSNENFLHLNGSVNYTLATASDIVFAARAQGQFADSHLVTNEQFAAGGISSVRGYFQSEAVGDDGITGSLEVRAPSLSPLLGSFVDELRAYAFIDAGYLHVQGALPGQESNFKLIGAGGGARLRLFDFLSGEIVVGVPLRAGPVSGEGDVRTVFVVRGEF